MESKSVARVWVNDGRESACECLSLFEQTAVTVIPICSDDM